MAERIDHTTIKPGGGKQSEPTTAERRWWGMSAKDACGAITATLETLHDQERARASQLVRSLRLYGNAPMQGFYGMGPQQATISQGPYRDRISYNVSQSVTDTVTSKIGKNKVRPRFLTKGGDFPMRRKAIKLTDFTDGMFYESTVPDLAVQAFRDCCVLGAGVLHPFPRNGRVSVERVMCSELKIDEIEGAYGFPRQMTRVKLIDRLVCAAAWPSKSKQIMDASNAWARDISLSRPHVADMLMVRESWHLPSGPEAKDGKHIVTLAEFPLTAMEDWNHDFFPFAILPWSTKVAGFWPQGLVEQVQPMQLEINKLLYLVQRSYHLGGSFKILMEMGSKIDPEHLNNAIGTVIKYQGTPPQYVVPPLLPPEIYQHLQWLIRSAYMQAGVDIMSAGGDKPAGLNSGRALRENADINTDRFQTVGKQYEKLHLDVAKIGIATARDMYDSGEIKHYEVKVPRSRWLETIDWKNVDVDEDDFVMQCFPVSSLPNEPAGKLETVQEMMQAGLVDPRVGKRLLNFPDIEQEESLSSAAEDFLQKVLDEMVEADEEYAQYVPEPYDNPQLGFQLAQQYYLAGKRDALEENKLERLRTFMAQCQALMQAAQPSPMPQQGAQPQNPPVPPQPNDMVPNVPGMGAA